jgi:transcriptional regulator with XRE-family HTH domain
MTQSYISASPAAGLLRLARLTSGLSQGRLAASAGVPATMISAYEREKRQPTLPTLLRLLNAAGFDLRMQLVPLDDGADVFADLDETRTPGTYTTSGPRVPGADVYDETFHL